MKKDKDFSFLSCSFDIFQLSVAVAILAIVVVILLWALLNELSISGWSPGENFMVSCPYPENSAQSRMDFSGCMQMKIERGYK